MGSLLLRSGPTPASVGSLLLRSGPTPAVGSLLLRSGPTPAVVGSLLLHSGPTPAVGSLLMRSGPTPAVGSLLLRSGPTPAVVGSLLLRYGMAIAVRAGLHAAGAAGWDLWWAAGSFNASLNLSFAYLHCKYPQVRLVARRCSAARPAGGMTDSLLCMCAPQWWRLPSPHRHRHRALCARRRSRELGQRGECAPLSARFRQESRRRLRRRFARYPARRGGRATPTPPRALRSAAMSGGVGIQPSGEPRESARHCAPRSARFRPKAPGAAPPPPPRALRATAAAARLPCALHSADTAARFGLRHNKRRSWQLAQRGE